MNVGAIEEIARIAPDCVVAKGDLTSGGRPEEYARFLERRTSGPESRERKLEFPSRSGSMRPPVPAVEIRCLRVTRSIRSDGSS